jgi:hypothetical protein
VTKQTFSPSEAALSVFELAKRQPQFVLKFCIIYALTVMITYAIGGATGVGKVMQDYIALTAGGRTPDPERVLEVLSPAAPGFAMIVFVGLILAAVTTAMGLRKAIRDEEQGLFGLQFGKDEINILLAMVMIGAILMGVNFALAIMGGFVTGGKVGIMFLVVFISVTIVAAIGLRLSQFGVLVIANQNISLTDWWNETKSQGWRFLGAYLLWIIIASIIALIAQSIAGIGAGAMGVRVSVGMAGSLGEFFKPGWLFYTLVYGLASGFGNLGSICVGAYAWHQMRGALPVTRTVG